jgi:hypothetical protein
MKRNIPEAIPSTPFLAAIEDGSCSSSVKKAAVSGAPSAAPAYKAELMRSFLQARCVSGAFSDLFSRFSLLDKFRFALKANLSCRRQTGMPQANDRRIFGHYLACE